MVLCSSSNCIFGFQQTGFSDLLDFGNCLFVKSCEVVFRPKFRFNYTILAPSFIAENVWLEFCINIFNYVSPSFLCTSYFSTCNYNPQLFVLSCF